MAGWPQDSRRLTVFWGSITLAAILCFGVAYLYGMRVGDRIAEGAVPVRKITEQRSAVSKFAYRTVDQGFRVRIPWGEDVPAQPRVTIVPEPASVLNEDGGYLGPGAYSVETEAKTDEEAAPGGNQAEDLLSRAGWSREPVAARRFSVDAGRYEDEQEMRAAAQRFRDRGYPVFIEEERRGRNVRYQLRVGAFERSSDAQTVRAELGRSGLMPGSSPATPPPAPSPSPSTPPPSRPAPTAPPASTPEGPAPTSEVSPPAPTPQPSDAPADSRPLEEL